MRNLRRAAVAVLLAFSIVLTARAEALPTVRDARVEGDRLVWSAVEGATGYNVYVGNRYLTTVRGALSLALEETGSYRVDAFDDDGNFSPAVGIRRAFYEGGTDNREYTWIVGRDAVYFTRRCFDVAAGEACVASCADSIGGSRTVLIGDASGGACGSSDTRHVNASVGPDGYTCTVSGFTARVEARAVCRIR